jgi:uncharacterized membrane protein
MAESLINALRQFLTPEVVVFIISLLPILELRGGLVAAKLLGVPWLSGYIISIIGNCLPIPFIVLFINRILLFLQHHGPLKKFAGWIKEKGEKGGKTLSEKYPNSLYWGLLLFVAIPLPGTGAWTGGLIAAILNLDKKKSLLAIFCGVVISSIIVSIIAYLIPGAFGL